MGEVVAVLLVPEKGDPLGLLDMAAGWCRPPTAEFTWDPVDWEAYIDARDKPDNFSTHEDWLARCQSLCIRRWREPEGDGSPGIWAPDKDREALMLAWGGEVLPDGCDRARSRRRPDAPWSPRTCAELLLCGGDVELWSRPLRDLGTILLIDADGREVAP